MADQEPTKEESKWLEVIGKGLAVLCLHQAGLSDKDMNQQAIFMRNIGLSNRDTAALLEPPKVQYVECCLTLQKKQLGRQETKLKDGGENDE